ncbi:MAG: peptide ABC transporter ATP-binding protein [Deltaproteobacteria bacterium RBG_16_48_10]|nr:MAG: peptide ABC transporter ATP-binding protein [Deltaproteobacteria bacterium RBG_16_48_10]
MNEHILLSVDSLKKFFTVKKGFPNPVKLTVKAVDRVTFEVRKKESFGLVGESGCGKSTVGRAILRLVEPDAGNVFLDGEDILKTDKARMKQLRQKIQIIFQDPSSSLNPRRKIGKALQEPLAVHKLGTAEEIRLKVDKILGDVGLPPEALDKFPHEFSGGQRQRIAIARALIFKPELIIADEPVSSLDVSIQSQILMLMEKLQEEYGLSYIFISHDLAVVRYFCHRVAIMYLGRVVEQGPRQQLFGEPLHPYTRTLLAASPIPDPRARGDFVRLEGEVASAIETPSGCYFHPRCPNRFARCEKEYPQWISFSPDRGVACHLYR